MAGRISPGHVRTAVSARPIKEKYAALRTISAVYPHK
jgi:hypothetical protein